MSEYPGQHSPDELDPLVSRLLDKRAYSDPLELDNRKQRVITRMSTRRGKWSLMRTRVATGATIAAFLAGSGGALAFANSGTSGSPQGATTGQYCKSHDREHGKCEHHPYHCHLKHQNCKREHHQD